MGPAIDAMLTMRPAFRSMKYGVIALHVRKTDLVLTVKVRSQSSSVLFVNGMPGGPAAPALLTRMSILPNVSRVRSTIVLTSAELVTSVFMARTLRPSPLPAPATFSAFSTWMSGMAISAPSRASASAMPRPIPLPPPVTTATLPSSRMKSPSIYNRCPGGIHDSTPAQKPQLVRAQRPRRIRPSLVAQDRRLQRRRLRWTRRGARLGHGCLAALGRAARGTSVGRGALRGRVVHVALERPLHGHGDRLHDGVGRRSARDDAAGQRGDSGVGLAAARDGGVGRAARGGAGASRRAEALADPHGPGLRQRDPRRHGNRRVDERDHPPRRDRRARRGAAAAQTLRRAVEDDAVPREPPAVRK